MKEEDTISSRKRVLYLYKEPFHIPSDQSQTTNPCSSFQIFCDGLARVPMTKSVCTRRKVVRPFCLFLGNMTERGRERLQDTFCGTWLDKRSNSRKEPRYIAWRLPRRSSGCIGHQSMHHTGAPAFNICAWPSGK